MSSEFEQADSAANALHASAEPIPTETSVPWNPGTAYKPVAVKPKTPTERFKESIAHYKNGPTIATAQPDMPLEELQQHLAALFAAPATETTPRTTEILLTYKTKKLTISAEAANDLAALTNLIAQAENGKRAEVHATLPAKLVGHQGKMRDALAHDLPDAYIWLENLQEIIQQSHDAGTPLEYDRAAIVKAFYERNGEGLFANPREGVSTKGLPALEAIRVHIERALDDLHQGKDINPCHFKDSVGLCAEGRDTLNKQRKQDHLPIPRPLGREPRSVSLEPKHPDLQAKLDQHQEKLTQSLGSIPLTFAWLSDLNDLLDPKRQNGSGAPTWDTAPVLEALTEARLRLQPTNAAEVAMLDCIQSAIVGLREQGRLDPAIFKGKTSLYLAATEKGSNKTLTYPQKLIYQILSLTQEHGDQGTLFAKIGGNIDGHQVEAHTDDLHAALVKFAQAHGDFVCQYAAAEQAAPIQFLVTPKTSAADIRQYIREQSPSPAAIQNGANLEATTNPGPTQEASR